MATRLPTLTRSAFLVALFVVALAVAPVADALSARASGRAGVKVDPEADPSSLLPTWPAGTDDPCLKIDLVDTGVLLGQDCKSYYCVEVVVHSDFVRDCRVRVNPGGAQLEIELVALPQVQLGPWNLLAVATDEKTLVPNHCLWTGDGNQLTLPGTLPPCMVDGAGPWRTRAVYGVGLFSEDLGTIELYFGPPKE